MLLMIDDINLTLLAKVCVCSAAEEESIVYNAVVGLPSSHYNSFTFDMYSCIKKNPNAVVVPHSIQQQQCLHMN